MNQEQIVSDNKVVSISYELWVDGMLEDSADQAYPLQYLHGHQNIIPGLEKALEGLSVGEKKTVIVPPEEGYGELLEDSLVTLERAIFPEEYNLEIGESLHLRQDDTEEIYTAYIQSYDDQNVVLDLNHPLAGKDLKFEVEVVEIRDASAHELEAGHIHSGCSACGGHCGEGGCA